MGQAIVDLPDPLEKQPNGASSADDLLAQLAGDEIDRMLTEANVDASSVVEEATTTQRETTEAVTDGAQKQSSNPSTASAVDDLLSSLDEPAPATAEAAASPSTTLDPNEIDKLLDDAITPPDVHPAPMEGAAKIDIDQALAAEADAKLAPHTAAVTAEAADDAAHAHASTIAAPATLTPPPSAEQATESAERDGLLATVAGEAKDDDEDPLAPLPIWLRPLEWLSAPMDVFSDEVRSFFGKAAILTLVNSAAVIIYVLMFRRH